MDLDKELIARIEKAQSEQLWIYDTNHSPIFCGYNEEERWRRLELAILSTAQVASATKGVRKHIRPYFDASFFQDKVWKMCIYIADKSIEAEMRRKIGEMYFGGEYFNFSYDHMKHYSARTEYLIFAHSVESNVPMAFVPPNSVIGEGLYAIADPDPWDIGILSSKMFAEWTKVIGSTDIYNGAGYFPYPPKQAGDDELMKPYIEPLCEMWRNGKTGEDPVALKKLNDYVDFLYLERCSGELNPKVDPASDRLNYLLALCDKRGALAKSEKEKADYNRQNILACPAVHRKSLPVFLAVLNNKKPVRPSDMGEYVVSSKYLEPYSAITRLTSKGMLRRVDTPRTFVDKNGRIQKTSYEATVDYMDFFVSWVNFYLPRDSEKRREVWQKAQSFGSEERNPLFPTLNEFKTLKVLWDIDKPLNKAHIKSHGGSPETIEKLLTKGLVEESVAYPGKYIPTISEVDFDTAAVREILSKITVDEKDMVISEIASLILMENH